jgi:hypothetical protein
MTGQRGASNQRSRIATHSREAKSQPDTSTERGVGLLRLSDTLQVSMLSLRFGYGPTASASTAMVEEEI